MIIWGTRTYLYTLAMLNLLCGNCGNPSAHSLKRRVTKFTLFFIPLFPISSRYLTQCTFCGATGNPTKEEADNLIASQGAQPGTPSAGPAQGQSQPGYPPQGQPQPGYPQQGYPQQGYPQQGGPAAPQGYPQQGQPGNYPQQNPYQH